MSEDLAAVLRRFSLKEVQRTYNPNSDRAFEGRVGFPGFDAALCFNVRVEWRKPWNVDEWLREDRSFWVSISDGRIEAETRARRVDQLAAAIDATARQFATLRFGGGMPGVEGAP